MGFDTIMPNNKMVFSDNITRAQNATDTAEIDIATMARSHYLFEASMVVNNYYGLLIIVCGLIGNTLSFIVMLQVCSWYQSSNSMIESKYYTFFWVRISIAVKQKSIKYGLCYAK